MKCTLLPAIIALPRTCCTCSTQSMAGSSLKRVQAFYRASGRKDVIQIQHKTAHSLSTYYKINLRLQRLLGSSVVRVLRLRYPADVLASLSV